MIRSYTLSRLPMDGTLPMCEARAEGELARSRWAAIEAARVAGFEIPH